jgi:hypothetical protein
MASLSPMSCTLLLRLRNPCSRGGQGFNRTEHYKKEQCITKSKINLAMNFVLQLENNIIKLI